MGRIRCGVAGLGLVLATLGCVAPVDPTTVADDGSGTCTYGTTSTVAYTLSAGPFKVKYDPVTGKPSFTVSSSISIGFLQAGIEGNIRATEPGCFTIVLLDKQRGERFIIPVRSETDLVHVEGAGSFDLTATQALVTLDTSQLCELRVFTSEQSVPDVDRNCGSTSEWVCCMNR